MSSPHVLVANKPPQGDSLLSFAVHSILLCCVQAPGTGKKEPAAPAAPAAAGGKGGKDAPSSTPNQGGKGKKAGHGKK